MSVCNENTVEVLKGTLTSGCSFTIQLPSEAIEELTSGKRWRGRVCATPAKMTGRASAIQQQIKTKRSHAAIVRATVPERKIIRAWNRSKYIQAQSRLYDKGEQRDSRNYQVPFKDIVKMLPVVRKALREVGFARIIRSMETYFDFCTVGDHIWEGKSHGFKFLNGFLEKIIALHKNKERPWWDTRETPTRDVKDENPRLTHRIAHSFAQTFMDEEKFPLEEGSKEHAHFQKTAQRMVTYINRAKRRGIELTQTQMIKYLLECVDVLFDGDGDVVYPAHLSSSATWDAALPQYLKEKGVI